MSEGGEESEEKRKKGRTTERGKERKKDRMEGRTKKRANVTIVSEGGEERESSVRCVTIFCCSIERKRDRKKERMNVRRKKDRQTESHHV